MKTKGDLKDSNTISNLKGGRIQYKYWCFTFNNYGDLDYRDLFENSVIPLNKYIVGEEIGKSGTKHLQGHIECKKKQRLTALKKIHPKIHWEPTRSNALNVAKYCSKDGKFINKGYNLPMPKYQVEIENLYPWQETVISWLNQEPNDRRIHYVWGEKGGEGKTHFQKYIATHREDVITLGGKGHDMKYGVLSFVEKNKKIPKIIFINVCRSGSLDYTGLEAIKDMYFFSGKYEGGMVIGPPPHVIIFSNEEPEWTELSSDRLHVIKINKNKMAERIYDDGGDFNRHSNCGTNLWAWKKA